MLVFIDGVGVGEDDPSFNPLAALELPAFEAICGGRPVRGGGGEGIDALLGVEGLPQSGTGQTTILTGLNAPAAIGKHFGPYANAELRVMLQANSLWRSVRESGRRAAFVNAYPEKMVDEAMSGGGRLGAFARSAVLAGVRLRGPKDLAAGNAVAADVVGAWWRRNTDAPTDRTDEPRAIGARLAALASTRELTMFECFLTDVAGHRRDRELAERMLLRLDGMLSGLIESIGSDRTIVLVSDHGNLEDMRDSKHSTNPAIFGWHGPMPRPPVLDLTGVAPAVRTVLEQAS